MKAIILLLLFVPIVYAIELPLTVIPESGVCKIVYTVTGTTISRSDSQTFVEQVNLSSICANEITSATLEKSNSLSTCLSNLNQCNSVQAGPNSYAQCQKNYDDLVVLNKNLQSELVNAKDKTGTIIITACIVGFGALYSFRSKLSHPRIKKLDELRAGGPR